MPKVSIIVPIYNVEQYLRECLDSVVNQTLKDIEIICVNDGSTDSSLSIIKEYAQKDNRIKIIDKPNSGYGDSMNKGLDMATGEYIGIVEPDDFVAKDMYEVLYNKATEFDVDFVKADFYYWWSKKWNVIYTNCITDKCLYNKVITEFYNRNLSPGTIANWAGIYKRDFINQYNIRHLPTPGASYQDQGFYYQIIFNAKKAFYVNKPFYYYRQDNMQSSVNNKNKIYCIFDEYEKIEEYLNKVENKEKFYPLVYKKKYNSCMWNYNRISDDLKPLFYEKLSTEFLDGYKNSKILRENFNRNEWQNIMQWVYSKGKVTNSPIEKCTTVPVVFATDDNGAKYLSTALVSLLENKNFKTYYKIYVLCDSKFSKNNKHKLETLVNKYYNSDIQFIMMNEEFDSLEMRISHITSPTYYRLKIAELLPSNFDKAIYLDIDTIILQDLENLYNTDMTNSYIAGVVAFGYLRNPNVHYYNSLGLTDLSNYINAGVTLWNLDKIRKDNLTPKLLELTKNNFQSQAQDIINLAFYNNILILPLKYNLMTKYSQYFIKDNNLDIEYFNEIYGTKEIEEAITSPHIIHYADKIKPWDNIEAYLGYIWWDYARKTDYIAELENNLQPKSKFTKKLFSITNQESCNKYYKVIRFLGIKMSFRNKKKELYEKVNSCLQNVNSINPRLDNCKAFMKNQAESLNPKIENISNFLEKLSNELNEQKNEIKKFNCTLNDYKRTIKSLEDEHKTALKSLTPQQSLRSFVYHLADHCNLKCKSCDHFSPLAAEKLANIDSFENDVKRLSELANQNLEIIKLMGGEPLLHPEINKFMEVSRKYFPKTRIEIVTNGLLLNQQNEEFWNACKKFDITIVPTKYPLNIDYDKAKETAQSYGVKYEYYNNTDDVIKTTYHLPLDIEGKQNAGESFMNCFHANWCVMLKDGKLYTCTIAPNIEHFNKYFGYNLPLTDRDGIDIYKAESMEEILEFLAKPIPFCKYCKVKERTFNHEWTTSKKDINEWI